MLRSPLTLVRPKESLALSILLAHRKRGSQAAEAKERRTAERAEGRQAYERQPDLAGEEAGEAE